MRIASLLPSATEILFALGLEDEIVGVSPECDFPPAARAKRVVSRNLIDPEAMAQGEIDASVVGHLQQGGALYHVDAEKLRSAAPDLIFTQNLCEVCAASIHDVTAVAAQLPNRPKIVSLDPSDLDDVIRCIQTIGADTSREAEARALVDSIKARLGAVAKRILGVAERPAVACIEWYDPLFNAGHWVPQMVELAGGEELLAQRGRPSRRVEWQDIVHAAPDVILLMPCGFGIERAVMDAHLVTDLPGWRDLPAVRRGRVFALDGSSYFSRPGPRLVDGVELLSHVFHPERFPKEWPKDAVRRMAV